MSIEVKHFDMLIDVINKLLEQTYYILSRIKYYDDLENEVEGDIDTIIYPMLCEVSKQTGISFPMVINKGFYKFFRTDTKQITPNTITDDDDNDLTDN